MAEHTETHEVPTQISEDITAAGGEEPEEWDAAWDSDEKDAPSPIDGKSTQGVFGKQSVEEYNTSPTSQSQPQNENTETSNDDTEEDAWGWGDEPDPGVYRPTPS